MVLSRMHVPCTVRTGCRPFLTEFQLGLHKALGVNYAHVARLAGNIKTNWVLGQALPPTYQNLSAIP